MLSGMCPDLEEQKGRFPPNSPLLYFPVRHPAPRTTTHHTRAPRSTALQPRSAQTKFSLYSLLLTVVESRAVVRCSDVIGFPTLGSAAKGGGGTKDVSKIRKTCMEYGVVRHGVHYNGEDNRY